MWQSILTFLTPKAWIGLALVSLLAISHGTAYHYGGKSVKQEWDAAITTQAQAMTKLSEEARAKEQALQAKVTKVQNDYNALKKANAASASAAADSLRTLNDVLAGANSANPAPASGAYGAGGLERELLGNCAAVLVQMGADADRLESKVVGLQDYIKSVLQNVAIPKQVPTK